MYWKFLLKLTYRWDCMPKASLNPNGKRLDQKIEENKKNLILSWMIRKETRQKFSQFTYCFRHRQTEKNSDVGIAKLVWYNEQLIFAVILNVQISRMNSLHEWY